jgi:hypothetical protein
MNDEAKPSTSEAKPGEPLDDLLRERPVLAPKAAAEAEEEIC